MAHLGRRLGPGAHAVALYHDLAECALGRERHVELDIRAGVDDGVTGDVADVRHAEPDGVGGEREAEEPVGVRGRARAKRRGVDAGADQHLASRRVGDDPAGDALGVDGRRQQDGQKDEQANRHRTSGQTGTLP